MYQKSKTYEVGTILKDVEWDEYYIITNSKEDEYSIAVYSLRDMADMSRNFDMTEASVDLWYQIVS